MFKSDVMINCVARFNVLYTLYRVVEENVGQFKKKKKTYELVL